MRKWKNTQFKLFFFRFHFLLIKLPPGRKKRSKLQYKFATLANISIYRRSAWGVFANKISTLSELCSSDVGKLLNLKTAARILVFGACNKVFCWFPSWLKSAESEEEKEEKFYALFIGGDDSISTCWVSVCDYDDSGIGQKSLGTNDWLDEMTANKVSCLHIKLMVLVVLEKSIISPTFIFKRRGNFSLRRLVSTSWKCNSQRIQN